MSTSRAEYMRQYRALRKQQGFRVDSGTKSTREKAPKAAKFVAIDGEGCTFDSGHAYMLLKSSSGATLIADSESGLSTLQCLSFLLDVARDNPRHIMTCFGASYDVNMMLKDVSYEDLDALWNSVGFEYTHIRLMDGVKEREFALRYRPHKEFSVKELALNASGNPVWKQNKQKKWERVELGKCTLWDVFGFFQSSFIEAIEKWLGSGYFELDIIRAGKARRSQFSREELPEINRYCAAELRALVGLMDTLESYLLQEDLQVSRYDGAGAIAARLLKREHVPDAIVEPPYEVKLASQHAYSGGRIELLKYGYHEGEIHHYDINSAYPTAATLLPSLDGEWQKTHVQTRKEAEKNWKKSSKNVSGESAIESRFSLVHVAFSYNGDNRFPLYPFFFRQWRNDIIFPSHGEGWYWYPEVAAAMRNIDKHPRTVGNNHLSVLDVWNFYPHEDKKPFEFIPDIYARRREFKARGIGAEKVLKLGMNSLYGKLAQQSGSYQDSSGSWHIPTFHSLELAGWITSYTRAQLYAAGMQSPYDIIFYATDGVYSLVPLNLPLGDGLGQWSYDTRDAILCAQSGVYWTWKDGVEHEFRRGYDRGSVSSQIVRESYAKNRMDITATSTRFVTLGSALSGGDMFSHWRQWRTIDRAFALSPEGTKRELAPTENKKTAQKEAATRLIDTIPATNLLPHNISKKYDVAWLNKSPEWSMIDGVDERIVEEERSENEL